MYNKKVWDCILNCFVIFVVSLLLPFCYPYILTVVYLIVGTCLACHLSQSSRHLSSHAEGFLSWCQSCPWYYHNWLIFTCSIGCMKNNWPRDLFKHRVHPSLEGCQNQLSLFILTIPEIGTHPAHRVQFHAHWLISNSATMSNGNVLLPSA